MNEPPLTSWTPSARNIVTWSWVSAGATLLATAFVIVAAVVGSAPDDYPGTDARGMLLACLVFPAFWLFVGGIMGSAITLGRCRRVTRSDGARALAYRASGVALSVALLVPVTIIVFLELSLRR